MCKNSLLAVAICLVSSPAYAQAFGIAMGTPAGELQMNPVAAPTTGAYFYNVLPPVPNVAFDHYIALAPPQTGVCRMAGFKDGVSADEASATYAQLKNALITFYGKPDNEVPGKELHFTSLPAPYSEIQLHVDAGSILLGYAYENISECVRYTDAGAGL